LLIIVIIIIIISIYIDVSKEEFWQLPGKKTF